ncbi:transglycosylase domain-containing protein [Streptacidiphilus monticola]
MGKADTGDPMEHTPLEAEDRMDGSSRARRQARKAERRARRRALPWYRRIIPTWRMALGGLLTVVLVGIAAFVGLYLAASVPNPNAQAAAQSDVYYYADGRTEIGQTGDVNRISVPIDQISINMQHAAVSAEDRTFYSNRGVSVTGMLRAAWDTVKGQGLQGGSTITQQYVKNYYLSQEQTITRKVNEFFISLKVDQTQSKNDIMAGYLNTSYFGRNAYGIQAAAQAYFGVSASQLTVAQSAYLASLLQAPSAYSSSSGQAALKARWNYTMDGMVKLGFVDQATRDRTAFPTAKANWSTPGLSGQAGYLIDIARSYLLDNKIMTDDQLAAGGWKIVTTFDNSDQKALAASVKKVFAENLPNSKKAAWVRAGAASIDPTTGKLVAAYGGPDYAKQQYNDATRTDIPVGSTFKAFDLAAGLENNATTQDGRPITPNTYYDGTSGRQVEGLPNGVAAFSPDNEDNVDYGQVTLRYAMQKSINSVYAQEAADAGLDNVRRIAIAAGLPADTPDMSAANAALSSAWPPRARSRWPAPTAPSPTTASTSAPGRWPR